jgi:hypothetical protein
MTKPLSNNAEILLLILAANGGSMDQPDLRREFERVVALTPAEQALWREWIAPLVQAHAARKIP